MSEVRDELARIYTRIDLLLADFKAGKPMPPDPELDELAKQAVESQRALRARLESPDPAVREAAESQVRKAATAFIMDTRFGGP